MDQIVKEDAERKGIPLTKSDMDSKVGKWTSIIIIVTVLLLADWSATATWVCAIIALLCVSGYLMFKFPGQIFWIVVGTSAMFHPLTAIIVIAICIFAFFHFQSMENIRKAIEDKKKDQP